MSTYICGTSVTIEHVKNDICQKAGIEHELADWSSKEITVGKGLLSAMAQIELKWVEQNVDLPKTVIAKIPTIYKVKMLFPEDKHHLLEATKRSLFNLHNCEISVYETLPGSSSIKLPKLWGTRRLSENGLDKQEVAYILMEDLSEQCTHWDMLSGEKLNEEQTKSVLRELASFHSWSLLNPDQADKIESFNPTEQIANMSEGFSDNLNKMKEFLKKLKFISTYADQQELFLGMRIEDIEDAMYKTQMKHHVPTTLCHGDVHVNNMMFVKDKDGKPSDQLRALIDWQAVTRGNPLFDVCRVINWLGPVSHRPKEARLQLLQVYFDELRCKFKESDKSLDFDFEQLLAAYWETSIGFGKWFLLCFPGILDRIESGKIPEIDDREAAAKKMFNDVVCTYEDVISIVNGKMS